MKPWQKCKKFEMRTVTESIDDTYHERSQWLPRNYFEQYIPDSVFEEFANQTNRRAVFETGKSLEATAAEMKRFIGISLLTSCLRYPRIRMYWMGVTRVPRIADIMSRNRYFRLRNNLKIVDDNDVSDDVKKADRLWKVRPLVDQVRAGCLKMYRASKVSIDEQMIPFSGVSSIKQYVPNKPNPVGLKNFVIANPDGLVLDFRIYQGKETFSDVAVNENVGLGGKAVLCLAKTIPRGTAIFCDRYFTSVHLLESLLNLGIYCSGTIMKNRCTSFQGKLISDKLMMKGDRGKSDAVVSDGKHMCLVKWYDNKPITLMSSFIGIQPEGECKRWSKKDSKFITIKCPAVVKHYNENMGGVDMNDRYISYYRMISRTKKWTVRTIFHMVDLALANSWIQYRNDRRQLGDHRKDIFQLLDFKLDVAESLMSESDAEARDSNSDLDDVISERPKKRTITPLPSDHKRQKGYHFPEFDTKTFSSRCRNEGCSNRTKVKCSYCGVFLCLTASRNCFKSFHSRK